MKAILYIAIMVLGVKATVANTPLHKPSTMDAMEWAAGQEGLNPAIVKGLCWVESSHKPKAIHFKDHGADSIGLCQIKVATAKLVGFKGSAKDLLNPYTNALYASKLLNKGIKRYGTLEYSIAAYNMGHLKIRRIKGKSTIVNKAYVSKVTVAMLRYMN
jgi:soluble lytic murein transglycosylase-like protein